MEIYWFFLNKLNKGGQFYLIAAVIIAGVIIGLTTISNYSIIEPNIKIYDLKEEIKTESRYVFDYGLNQNMNDLQLYGLITNFVNYYVDYLPDKDLYFIFGSKTNLSVAGYQKQTKTVYLNGAQITTQSGRFSGSINPQGATEIILNIDNLRYVFPMNEGKNFYLIISQKTIWGEYIVNG
ncbi:MAG: hypothetical protein QXD63_02375 [Candidatus Pacearchaeota archaeon]